MAIVRRTLEDVNNHHPTEEDKARLQALKDINDDDIDFSDIPELTKEDFARAIPAKEFWQMRKQAKADKPNGAIITIDKGIFEKYKSKAQQTNSDYQTLIDNALEEYLLAH